ncbi:MAG: hypothetical protein ABS46_12455 [Cytophagaceae bacterium SCN 52-12]|nr:MAG: hypothetical protein ABS46_12455 [Cytophagaceae bacterium SCN 52-12]
MEEFSAYDFRQFISDPDFRRWVKAGCSAGHPVWGRILIFFPEKAEVVSRAILFVEELEGTELRVSPEVLDDEVNRILDAAGESRGKARRFGGWYRAAAVVLCGLMIWFLKPEKTETLAAYQYLKAADSLEVSRRFNASDAVVAFWLPDGSLAQLYPGALLKYPVDGFGRGNNEKDRREVYMSGDIFFEIEKDTARPFFVYAEGLVTRVVGTSFLVSAVNGKSSVEVRSGKVMVRPLDGDDGDEVALTPNQVVTYSAHVGQLTRGLSAEPEMLTTVDVPETAFEFENTPVDKVFDRLTGAYGIPVRFDQDVLKGCSLTVKMGGEPFYDKLDIICRTIGAEYSVAGGEVVITGEGCD